MGEGVRKGEGVGTKKGGAKRRGWGRKNRPGGGEGSVTHSRTNHTPHPAQHSPLIEKQKKMGGGGGWKRGAHTP